MITKEEKAVIVKLRQSYNDEFPSSFTSLSVEDQDLFLVRWIRARDLDLEKSTNMLRNSLKWRNEKNADQALDFKIHPFYTENFVYEFCGTDKLGQPVVLVPLNDWDLRKVVSNVDRIAEFDEFAILFFEMICKHIKEEHMKRGEYGHGPVTQMIIIFDVKNYSYMQLMDFGAVKKIIKLASIYEAHYPEILYRAIFINCPQYFGMFITILKSVVAAKTIDKIKCYPKMLEWQQAMKELMDTAQIPERYGGSKLGDDSQK